MLLRRPGYMGSRLTPAYALFPPADGPQVPAQPAVRQEAQRREEGLSPILTSMADGELAA